ncbi:MAG: tRNA (adenosine(37)-N6)-threonylcarbamoyltransferase complex dimerization subunit type 1 TsaB [Hyphomicrobiales bacterium]|nr:tRNA (adenosine(37)-N6)-threonylcarbamoyltransferase complex dimerization subunit type 1 TsaB [Hyphomicrobiales bacterium]MDE2114151.1 tRNA (adenosine(37)-N6)-threonylcarbamoyltransferase complex dimerization subunit type 1 TsaB [Hyphomicrobiales bacterium]
MKILAMDTAQGATAVCVYDSQTRTAISLESTLMQRGHAEALLPMVDRVIANVPGGFSAIGRVAVTVGPGSFTGIRVGVSAARAFGLACNIPVVGVSTLAALASSLVVPNERGTIAAAIDARHGQIYLAIYSAAGAQVLSPRIVPVRDGARLLGSDRARLCGSGAPMLAIEAWNLGLSVDVAGELIAPDIALVARLGLLADPEQALPSPMYLKPPDAKLPQSVVRAPSPSA